MVSGMHAWVPTVQAVWLASDSAAGAAFLSRGIGTWRERSLVILAFGLCDGAASIIGSGVPSAQLACMLLLLASAALLRRELTRPRLLASILLACSADNLLGAPHGACEAAACSAAMAAAGLLAGRWWQLWAEAARRPIAAISLA